MSSFNLKKQSKSAVSLNLVTESKFKPSGYSKDHQLWMKAQSFEGKSGQLIQLPCPKKGVDQVVLIVEDMQKTKMPFAYIWTLGALPQRLPKGDYVLQADLPKDMVELLVLGWALGAYQFSDFKTKKEYGAHLIMPKNCDAQKIQDMAASISLTRDLINRPANDLMPSDLWKKVKEIGKLLPKAAELNRYYSYCRNTCQQPMDYLSDQSDLSPEYIRMCADINRKKTYG